MLEPEYRSGATTIAEESVELDEPSVSSEWAQWSTRIESMIERYPWPTILLALGFGYLLARRLR
jgi:predicted alpha/beta hydrolase family esterase